MGRGKQVQPLLVRASEAGMLHLNTLRKCLVYLRVIKIHKQTSLVVFSTNIMYKAIPGLFIKVPPLPPRSVFASVSAEETSKLARVESSHKPDRFLKMSTFIWRKVKLNFALTVVTSVLSHLYPLAVQARELGHRDVIREQSVRHRHLRQVITSEIKCASYCIAVH